MKNKSTYRLTKYYEVVALDADGDEHELMIALTPEDVAKLRKVNQDIRAARRI